MIVGRARLSVWTRGGVGIGARRGFGLEHQYTPSEHGDLVAEARELGRRAKLDFLAVLNSQALPLIEQRLYLHNVREKIGWSYPVYRLEFTQSSNIGLDRDSLTLAQRAFGAW